MGAAGNVEKQTIRRIESNERRVAIAPIGNRFQKPRIAGFIRIDGGKIGIHRARIGERHAFAQAELCGFVVEA